MIVRRNVATLVLAMALALGASAAQAEGDAVHGKKVFKKCAACHSLEAGKKKIGPSLHGVMGRTAGTLDGFKYSKAMVAYGESGKVWDAETLSIYLEAPRKVVKGTRMSYGGLKKPKDRDDLIAYLIEATN